MKVIDTDGKELYDFSPHKLKLWERIYYPCYRLCNKVRLFPREVKWFIQRGKRGYADSDCWGIDFYLVDIIPKMIKQLKGNRGGVPSCMFEDADDDSDKSWEKARKKWYKILDEIIKSFSLMEKELEILVLTEEEIKIRNNGVKQRGLSESFLIK
ncbi:hypothetical protein LCGC14_3038370 [marine sediment metagenome]|uniref:Uncharacterized protein n=1 Tax=marine sediment metagenome TaxID=412755 RepID=A0A0F8ZGA6_9ZZZZ